MAPQRFTTRVNRAEKRLTRAHRRAVKVELRRGNWENLPERKRIFTCRYGKHCCLFD